MSGGPTAMNVAMAKRKYTQADYKEMGKFISEVLRKRKVWLILMPVSKNTNRFIKSVETNKDWQVIFFNNKQKMFVDIKSDKGLKLMEGIVTSETVYPDEFSRNLMLSRVYGRQKSEASVEIGLKNALQAFQINPSQIPLLEIVSFARYTKLKPQVDDFCKKYVQEINENIDKYRNEDSYFNRITAATLAVRYLERAISKEENPQLFRSFANMKRALKIEQSQISKTKKW
jgi:hypothetical protein